MNKDNQFRSSLFHMDEGDVLHMIIIDEQGTPLTVTLNTQYPDGSNNEEEYPDNPIATAASDILETSFTANWYFAENALGYYLDVALDEDFTTYVAGFEDLDVGNVDEYSVTGLIGVSDYYYRLRAYNSIGASSYSNVITLTTALGNALVDKDGNVYTVVTIGTQQWIVQNLRTTTYADDAAIVNIADAGTWIADTTGAYCWYDNDISYKTPYGAIYNKYAVDNASGLVYFERAGVQETGWKVPDATDWATLIAYIGGASYGYKLKEIGLSHWDAPNTGATDTYGLACIGGGIRDEDAGAFDLINEYGYFWIEGLAYAYVLGYSSSNIVPSIMGAANGLSIRCVKDLALAPLMDKDGNIYTTVTIGAQKWTVENLRTTTYADGSPIGNIEVSTEPNNDPIDGWVNVGFDTFISSDENITSAIGSGDIGEYARTMDVPFNGTNGGNFIVGTFNLTLNSGTAPKLYLKNVALDTTYWELQLSDGINNFEIVLNPSWSETNIFRFVIDGNGNATNFSCTVVCELKGWVDDTTGAYCWYDNDEATYGGTYGALYNWYAIDNASGLAYLERDGVEEAGWRVPTQVDFDTLSTYLGGGSVAGGKLKETGITHWTTPNTGATNEMGFTAIGAGYRDTETGNFSSVLDQGYIWASSEGGSGGAYYRGMTYTSPELFSYDLNKEYGFSIRLVKDV